MSKPRISTINVKSLYEELYTIVIVIIQYPHRLSDELFTNPNHCRIRICLGQKKVLAKKNPYKV
jgi:hypothetical protein